MENKDNLVHLWQERMKYWYGDASHTFEQQHLNELIECMEELEREYEKFKGCVERCPQ